MIIECHVRSDLPLPSARANQIAISSFCPLLHFFVRYFNKNSKTTNQSDLRNNAQHIIKAMFTLYRIDFRSGSGIDPIQCEQCLGKSNRTGPVWSWAVSHHMGSIFILVWQKQTYPRVQESDNGIPFQKWCQSAEHVQVVHIRSGAFQKAIRYGTYHFWNRSVRAVTGIATDWRGEMWTEGLSDTVFGTIR